MATFTLHEHDWSEWKVIRLDLSYRRVCRECTYVETCLLGDWPLRFGPVKVYNLARTRFEVGIS